MSWMGWVVIGIMAFCAVFFGIVIIVSVLEGWRWKRNEDRKTSH